MLDFVRGDCEVGGMDAGQRGAAEPDRFSSMPMAWQRHTCRPHAATEA